jgi:hypothetical protein
MLLEIVPGRRLGPVEMGMTRSRARAALQPLGRTIEVTRWRNRPPVLAAHANAIQVYFNIGDVVEEVEVASGLGAELSGIVLLDTYAATVLSQVSALLGEAPTASESDTSFEWASGLRLWRQTRDAGLFTTAVVFSTAPQNG